MALIHGDAQSTASTGTTTKCTKTCLQLSAAGSVASVLDAAQCRCWFSRWFHCHRLTVRLRIIGYLLRRSCLPFWPVCTPSSAPLRRLNETNRSISSLAQTAASSSTFCRGCFLIASARPVGSARCVEGAVRGPSAGVSARAVLLVHLKSRKAATFIVNAIGRLPLPPQPYCCHPTTTNQPWRVLTVISKRERKHHIVRNIRKQATSSRMWNLDARSPARSAAVRLYPSAT